MKKSQFSQQRCFSLVNFKTIGWGMACIVAVALFASWSHAADPFGNGTIKTPTTASGGTGTAADLQTDNDVNYTVAKEATASIGGFGTHGSAISSVYLFVQYTVEPGYTGSNAIQVNGVNTPIVPAVRDYGRWAYIDITGGSFGVDTSAEISNLSVTFTNNDGGDSNSVLLDCAYVVVNPQTAIPTPPTWSEDFNGTGQANPMVWNYEVGYQRNNELQYYVAGPSNGWQEGGNFVIEGRKETMGGYNYTSASIVTGGKYYWRFGRAQIRAKIPAKPGMWPAIWGTGNNGSWPHGGEVDILEYYAETILANVAVGTTVQWGSKWDSATRSTSSLLAVDSNWRNEWHIWTMQWDDVNVRLYMDNILVNTIPQTWMVNTAGYDPAWGPQYPFQSNGMSCWLNLAMGGQGGDPTATMNSGPQRYLIDYWKIWEGATSNVAPTDIALSGSGVVESQAIGTVVGNLSATDADPAEVHKYTLVTGTGSTHNAQFTIPEFISGSTTQGIIKTAAVLNYADGATRSIRVRVTDIEGLTFEKMLTINVMPMLGITIGAISGNTTEAGGTATFTVKLKSQPTANVTIGLSSSDTTEGTVSPSSLTFTSLNWNTDQTVTVTGVDDAAIDGNVAYTIVTAAASSTDTNYNGLNPADVSVTNNDNDNPAPVSIAGYDHWVSVSSASPWTPTQITKAAWFDASDANTLWNATTGGSLVAAGGTVARWDDKSGNNRHATQLTSGSRPIYQSNALNGLPVIDFDGLDDMFAMGGTTVSVQNVFAVFNFEGGASITGWPWVFGSKGTPDIPVFYGWDTLTNVGSDLPQKGAVNCTLYVNGVGNGAVGNIALLNTYDIVHASGASASPSRSNWWIGDGDGKWNGRIAELVVLSSTISADDRQRMEGYLAHKWGTTATLPTNHLYKTLAPKVPVSVNLDGTATDSNGDTLITTWTKVSGPGIVTFGNANAVDTTAAFDIPGTYVLGFTVSDGTSQTYDECVITVAPTGNPYDTWASNNATTGTLNDDFDGDGVTNIIEFVLGGDKNTKDVNKLPTVATPGSNMTFTFLRNRNSINPKVSVKIEVSTDLTTWPDVFTVAADTASSTTGVTVTNNGNGTDTVTLTLPQGAATKKFAHLKVDIIP